MLPANVQTEPLFEVHNPADHHCMCFCLFVACGIVPGPPADVTPRANAEHEFRSGYQPSLNMPPSTPHRLQLCALPYGRQQAVPANASDSLAHSFTSVANAHQHAGSLLVTPSQQCKTFGLLCSITQHPGQWLCLLLRQKGFCRPFLLWPQAAPLSAVVAPAAAAALLPPPSALGAAFCIHG